MITLVTHPYHRGGVTSWIIDMVNYAELNQLACDLVTVIPKNPFISGKLRPTVVDLVNKDYSYLPKVGYEYELGSVEYRANVLFKEICKQVPQHRVLIPSDDEACWMACAMAADTYPMIAVLHGDDETYYSLFTKYKRYLSGVVTVSDRIGKNINSDTLPVSTIPCGVSLELPGDSKKRENKLVFCGRLEERIKRVSDLIPIFRKVKDEIPDASLSIWGHGDYSEKLLKEVEENHLQNSVKLNGWGEKLAILNELSNSKLLLQTSNFEGMSIAVMEALAMGCSVVSSKVSGVEDYVNRADTKGILSLYSIGDVAMAAELCVKSMHEHTTETSENATVFFEKRFSMKACYAAYEELANEMELKKIESFPALSWLGIAYSKGLAALRMLKYQVYTRK
jgi:glycosyltransferase involved in cell wall biosynthesis